MKPETATVMLERSPFYLQARQYCEEHALGPEALPSVVHRLAMQSFHERSKPWMDAKVKLFSLSLQPQPEAYVPIDEIINRIARECGLTIARS